MDQNRYLRLRRLLVSDPRKHDSYFSDASGSHVRLVFGFRPACRDGHSDGHSDAAGYGRCARAWLHRKHGSINGSSDGRPDACLPARLDGDWHERMGIAVARRCRRHRYLSSDQVVWAQMQKIFVLRISTEVRLTMSAVWDKRARFYDMFEGSDLRRGPAKAALFRAMAGRVLFVAVGTGLDVKHFPPDREIIAIDISDEMLRRAAPRCQCYAGNLRLVQADALNLCFPDDSFDTVVTSCTMCSVPNPRRALEELYRVLRPGGQLLMFEHMQSRNWVLSLVLDLMTLFTRRKGTEMNRHTLDYVIAAGFHITQIECVFLDIILSIHGVKTEMTEHVRDNEK